jgi:peptide/nickel transport system permease protein
MSRVLLSARRLLFLLLLIFAVSSLSLLLVRMAPGDGFESGGSLNTRTIAAERAREGLDLPLLQVYGDWLSRALRFDMGTSRLYGRPVRELIYQRSINTALLAFAALLLATAVGLPLGVVSGSRPPGVVTGLIRGASLVALSLPPLITSLLLVMVAARTGWVPVGGMSSTQPPDGWLAAMLDVAWHMPVPALALALPIAAMLERLQSESMATTAREPFVMAAVARGISRRRVVWRNALRPSLLPVASLYGFVIGGLLSGSFIVEVITAWPGLGRLTFDALRARDVNLAAGCAVAGAIFLAAGSLVSDLAVSAADPRGRGDD